MRFLIAMVVLLSTAAMAGCGETDTVGAPPPRLSPDRTRAMTWMAFAPIPPGTFVMGAAESEEGSRKDERPTHEVRISRAFYMSKREVTHAQFAAFVADTGYRTSAEVDGWASGHNPEGRNWGRHQGLSWKAPGFDQTDDHPVVCVSYADAVAFCKWLSRKSGKHVRLPTEAEWEYACRAGSRTRFSFGDRNEDLHKNGNYADRSNTTVVPVRDAEQDDGFNCTAPVGSYPANAWGLYDMHGNVHEWCSDRYGKYTSDAADDPTGPAEGSNRVLRGGAWVNRADYCRSAYRNWDAPDRCSTDVGFRVVLEADAR